MTNITIVKIGGHVIDDPKLLSIALQAFSNIKGPKLLVHGGGTLSDKLATKLGIPTKKVKGRRITDAETIDLVTMVYAGLINKKIVAQLQALGCNALGLSGADCNSIKGKKRAVKEVDYGFVGDLTTNSISGDLIANLLQQNITPVFCAITHDGEGNLLNTNADTIGNNLGKKLAEHHHVRLIYCFEKKGVLSNPDDEGSLILSLSKTEYQALLANETIVDGMIPKLENAYDALEQGVQELYLCNPTNLASLQEGTKLYL